MFIRSGRLETTSVAVVAQSGRGEIIIGDYVNRDKRHKKQVMGGFPRGQSSI